MFAGCLSVHLIPVNMIIQERHKAIPLKFNFKHSLGLKDEKIKKLVVRGHCNSSIHKLICQNFTQLSQDKMMK